LNLTSQLFRRFGVFTNGTLLHKLDDSSLKELKDLSVNGNIIGVSLDSTSPLINDKTRGLTEASLKGLRTLEERGIDFSVCSVCTKYNINVFEETLRYLLTNFKHFVGIRFNFLEPTPVLGDQYFKIAEDEKAITECKIKFKHLQEELHREDATILARNKEALNKSIFNGYNLTICDAGATIVAVLANGDVVPCPVMRSARIGNLYKESWKTISEKALNNYKNLIDKHVEGRKCNLVTMKTPALCCYVYLEHSE
jgi:MoaA/NifB/PqqE/SkfB family radical SAM enzyme